MKKSWLCLPLMFALLSPRAWADPVEELTTAAYRDNGSAIATLLLHGTDVNARDAQGRSALELAIREQNEKAFKALLAAPALDLNSVNAVGETPLMLAAIKGRLDWVQLFVKRGAQINRAGWTPLHYAASGPDEGISAWLIAHGAEINARAPNGNTPLMMAAKYGPYDLAELLLKLGADPSLRNAQGSTAADFAASVGREPLARHLREMQH
jgi:ankyrin repeat protein